MSILIHMEMPKDGESIVVSSDGTAYKYNPGDVVMYGDAYNETAVAVELPPHGRLIDADAVIDEAFQPGAYGYVDAIQIENATTIIPADPEGGNDNG